MTQFDVYVNPSTTTNKYYPYFVDIQNPFLETIASRVVIPLVLLSSLKNQAILHLTPIVKYEGEKYLLLTQEISSIPNYVLNKPIGSLQNFRNEIIAALDFLVTGI